MKKKKKKHVTMPQYKGRQVKTVFQKRYMIGLHSHIPA